MSESNNKKNKSSNSQQNYSKTSQNKRKTSTKEKVQTIVVRVDVENESNRSGRSSPISSHSLQEGEEEIQSLAESFRSQVQKEEQAVQGLSHESLENDAGKNSGAIASARTDSDEEIHLHPKTAILNGIGSTEVASTSNNKETPPPQCPQEPIQRNMSSLIQEEDSSSSSILYFLFPKDSSVPKLLNEPANENSASNYDSQEKDTAIIATNNVNVNIENHTEKELNETYENAEPQQDETNLTSIKTPPKVTEANHEQPSNNSMSSTIIPMTCQSPSSSPKLSRTRTPNFLSLPTSYNNDQHQLQACTTKSLSRNENLDEVISSILQDNNSSIDPSKIWLYKSPHNDIDDANNCPDIILNLIEDDKEKDSEEGKSCSPIFTPSELKLLKEQENNAFLQEQEIQVYVEQGGGGRRGRRSSPIENLLLPPPKRNITDRRSGSAHSANLLTMPGTGSSSPSTQSVTFQDGNNYRRDRLRKASSVSRVLIVNDDNQHGDLYETIEMDALSRRLSRDNYGAINLLSYIGDELELDSGEQTPVGFEYSDNVLKRRFLLSWKVAANDGRHKKSINETDLPLAATKFYSRPINKWRRLLRLIRMYCICCLSAFRLRRRRVRISRHNEEDDTEFYERNLIKIESIEAFQAEMDVMENVYRFRRISRAKRGSIFGATKSIKDFQKHVGHQSDRKYMAN